MSKLILSHLALLIVNLIYGASFFIAKGVMPHYLSPNSFILLRVICTAFLFWVIKSLFIKEKIKKEDIKLLAICGFFGVSINMLLFFKGLNLTSPIDSSIMMMTTPVLVTLLSFIILKNKLTLSKVGGVTLGLIGAVYLIQQGASDQTKQSDMVGNLLVFLNASSYGIYLVLVKPLMEKYSPITIISAVFLFGLIYTLPFGLYDIINLKNNYGFNSSIIWSIVFVVFGSTFIAYLFNILALRHVSTTVSASYIYLQPVFAMIIGGILSASGNGYHFLTLQKIVATLLIFLGVFLVSKKSFNKSAE